METYTFYKIVSKNPEIKECYVGVTTDFSARKNQHRSSCCNRKNVRYNSRVYTFMRDNGGWDAWDKVVIERRQLESKHEVFKKEAELIKSHGGSLNTVIYSRTDENRILINNPSSYIAENPELFLEKSTKPDNTIIDYKDVIPSDLMPLFSGITGLDENYERVIAPNDDNDHGLARIIAKKYGSNLVCVNIKKNVWYKLVDKHVDEPDDEPDDDGLSDYISKYRPADKWSLFDCEHLLRTLVSTTFYEYLNGVLSSVKTDYMDKYDKKILNTYRINTLFSHIVKLMNDLHKSTKIKKIMVELRALLYQEDFLKKQEDIEHTYAMKEFIDERIIPCEDGFIIKNILIHVYGEWYNNNYGYKNNNIKEIVEGLNNKYKTLKSGVFTGICLKQECI
jgi:hypothetical protein